MWVHLYVCLSMLFFPCRSQWIFIFRLFTWHRIRDYNTHSYTWILQRSISYTYTHKRTLETRIAVGIHTHFTLIQWWEVMSVLVNRFAPTNWCITYNEGRTNSFLNTNFYLTFINNVCKFLFVQNIFITFWKFFVFLNFSNFYLLKMFLKFFIMQNFKKYL